MRDKVTTVKVSAAPTSTPSAPPPAPAPAPTAVAPTHNPFASLTSTGQETAAATKLYEVPRELIEIARANAGKSAAVGTTTPLAPRPDAELEATLRAYTERLSSKPPRLPLELLVESIPPEAEPEPMPLTSRRGGPASAKASLATARPRAGVRAESGSRAWLVYAAICVMGLASCAHVLFGS